MIKRIERSVKRIAATYRQDYHFSAELANTRLIETLARYSRMRTLAEMKRRQKDEIILSFLAPIASEAIKQTNTSQKEFKPEQPAPIWICWWDEIEEAPELVKKCIWSIRYHADDHPICLITKKNYTDYILIPKAILNRVNEGQICKAHLSDYIRFSLLNKFGGLWIDSTVFVTNPIPESCFERPLFTCNCEGTTPYIANGRWATFVFGGEIEHPLFQFIQTSLELYWDKYDRAIDYLFLDHLIHLAYENIEDVHKDIDSIPINNIHRNDLRAAMNRAVIEDRIYEYMNEDTWVNKLSWREEYQKFDKYGNETIYSAFLRYYDGNR